MKPVFTAKPAFYPTLRASVDQYFRTTGQKTSGNAALLFKSSFILAVHGTLYWLLISGLATGWMGAFLCVCLGFSTVAIGCNIMHDGNHGTFSDRKWLNESAAATLSLLGADRFLWQFKHVGLHHPFTNIHGADGDIEVHPLMRICPTQAHKPWHRWQHFYALGLYAIYFLLWIFVLDFYRYFSGQTNGFKLPRRSLAGHFEFWFFKIFHFWFMLGWPILKFGAATALTGFLIYSCVLSFFITAIFQMAHAVEHVDFPKMAADGQMPDEWAVHQVEATANFATQNPAWNWLCGGLNFQIEHHLFPNICHVHYRALQPMVKKACLEYGLVYQECADFGSALASHRRFLATLGKPETQPGLN